MKKALYVNVHLKNFLLKKQKIKRKFPHRSAAHLSFKKMYIVYAE